MDCVWSYIQAPHVQPLWVFILEPLLQRAVPQAASRSRPWSSRNQRREVTSCPPEARWSPPVDFPHRCLEGSGSISGGCASSGHRGCVCLSPCPWVTLRHPCPNGQRLAVSCSGSTGLGRLPRFRPRGLPLTPHPSVLSCTCPQINVLP